MRTVQLIWGLFHLDLRNLSVKFKIHQFIPPSLGLGFEDIFYVTLLIVSMITVRNLGS
jgi:hypothetical protein